MQNIIHGRNLLAWMPSLALLVAVSTTRLFAYEFTVEGHLRGSRYSKGKLLTQFKPVEFTVHVDGCRWYISVREEGSTWYHEASHDGTNYFRYGCDTATNEAGALVTDEPVPAFGATPHIPTLWLAFASRCYLNDASGDRLLPPYGEENSRIPLKAEIIRRPDGAGGAGLPERATYFVDGFLTGTGERKRLPRPYENGFKEADYSAFDFLSTNGVAIPRRFELRTFQPVPTEGSDPVLDVGLHYEGVVNHVRPKNDMVGFAPRFDVHGRSAIKDYRFLPSGHGYRPPFVYVTNKWLSREQAEELESFKAYAAALPRLASAKSSVVSRAPPPSRVGLTGNAVLMAILLAGALPLLMLLIKRTLSNSQK